MKMPYGVDLSKEVPMNRPEQSSWAVTHSAIVHARKRHSKMSGVFFALLICQIAAGGDPHANIPSASNPPLSSSRIPDGASMGLTSHRKTGSRSKATKRDPEGNQLEPYPLSLVPSPAGWEIRGATRSAPSGRPTSAPFFVRSPLPDLRSSPLTRPCRSRPDGTPSGGQTWSPNAPYPPATTPPVEAQWSAAH
jgi:hypothetical protein